MLIKKSSVLLLIFALTLLPVKILSGQNPTGKIHGIVKEKTSGTTMPSVNIVIEGTLKGAMTDSNGEFTITGLAPGIYTLVFTYISYDVCRIAGVEVGSDSSTFVFAEMSEASLQLGDVVVVATKRNDSEVTVLENVRNSTVVVTGISAQLISRTQDKDASEVVKRLPGISVVDDRFVVVRGLSSRYNNVWLNNSTAPSLEADVRSFSFDLVPSSMIESIMILKSPSAELPADYAGGFIKISTTGIPSNSGLSISYGTALRQYSTFAAFDREQGASLDWLTSGVKYRSLPGNMPGHLDIYESATNPVIRNRVTEIGTSLNNSWSPVKSTAIPDQKLSISLNKRFEKRGFIAGNVTALTYSYSNTFNKIENNSYSIYNYRYDVPGITDQFTDRQYKEGSKIGLLHNWTAYPAEGLKIEFKNFLSRTSQSRLTFREGQEWYNNGRHIRSGEIKYTNRTIYAGQLGAEKHFDSGNTALDLTAGYSLSFKEEPDIRRYRYISNEDETIPYLILFGNNPDLSSVSRMWLGLDEANKSLAVNFLRKAAIKKFKAEIRAGFFTEKKTRSFNARNFGYALAGEGSSFSSTTLPVSEIFKPDNINLTDGIKLKEVTSLSDSYDASGTVWSGYAGLRMNFHSKIDLSLGLRLEKETKELSGFRQGTATPVNVLKDTITLFPSANVSFAVTSKAMLRFTYGLSVNRPEFREMAPFYFVDFEQNAGIYGNENLKQAYIQNFDLRFEYYPGNNETLNAGLFYKSFSDPIEVVIRGNNPNQFSFDNITSAYSFGFELEARKSLRFISERFEDFSGLFNLSLIRSSVSFDRPLQGQSPYIINAGLFYQPGQTGFNASIIYNRIGKRIIAVGRPSPNEWESIPDIYEMPRNEVDVVISKKIGERIEVRGSIKDLFGERIEYRQNISAVVDMSYYGSDGFKTFNRTQITRSFYPGRQFSLGLTCKF